MKNFIRYIFIFFLGCSGKLISQDSVHVYNVHAMIISPQPSITVGATNTAPNSFTLVVYISVDKPDSTANFNILIGNGMNDGSLENQQIKMVKHPAFLCMHDAVSNKEISRFYGKNTKYEIVLNQAGVKQLRYITVDAKHKNGNNSQKKYFKIQ